MKTFWPMGLLLLASATAGAAAPGVNDAIARIQSGDMAGARKILKAHTHAHPDDAAAWRYLGSTELKLKHPGSAEAAFGQALRIQPDAPQALYNMAIVAALRGDRDEAFAWLGKARATHKLDLSGIPYDPDLATLKGDPRFAALLPVAADFDNPFVEPVKIIGEWRGEHANDQFGWIARDIGDVDGDGAHDFVTSAPNWGPDGNTGRVYVYSSKTGKLLWSALGEAGDQLGTGVEAAGDVDGDGLGDVIAAGPTGNVAHVYSGKDGRVLFTFHGEAKSDNYGQHASGAGDFDGDGRADAMVGAPNNAANGKDAGRAYLYSGKDGHVLLTLSGAHAGDQFGSTVSGYAAGAQRALVIGAPGAGPRHTGEVYVYDALSVKPRYTFSADESGRQFGAMFVGVPGDIDGDGVADIYVSDWNNAALGPSTGRVYAYSGKSGQRLLRLTGETQGEGFGTTHATAGDVDGDGHADLAVGSWQYAGAAISGGRVILYSGASGKPLATYTCRTPGDTFGFDAVGIGDVDGDGITDLLVTSGWSAVSGFHSGRVFVISSGVKKKT